MSACAPVSPPFLSPPPPSPLIFPEDDVGKWKPRCGCLTINTGFFTLPGFLLFLWESGKIDSFVTPAKLRFFFILLSHPLLQSRVENGRLVALGAHLANCGGFLGSPQHCCNGRLVNASEGHLHRRHFQKKKKKKKKCSYGPRWSCPHLTWTSTAMCVTENYGRRILQRKTAS